MYDILVSGNDTAEYDIRLVELMRQLESAVVTLNAEKCKFRKEKVKFLGLLKSKEGFIADPEKANGRSI